MKKEGPPNRSVAATAVVWSLIGLAPWTIAFFLKWGSDYPPEEPYPTELLQWLKAFSITVVMVLTWSVLGLYSMLLNQKNPRLRIFCLLACSSFPIYCVARLLHRLVA